MSALCPCMLDADCASSCGRLPAVHKAVQSRLLSALASPAGSLLCLAAALWCALSVLAISSMALWGDHWLLTGSVVSAVASGEGMDARLGPVLNGYPAIDVVYTWVNGSDPAWQLQKALYSQQQQQQRQQEAAHTTDHISGLNDEPISAAEANETALEIAATAASRYRSSDELLYSIRSLFRFAPWVRHVYVVTAGQVPSWMVDYHPQLTVVPHSALYPNQSHLPTFSSSSIEVHLHRLEGLSEHWLYFNDDVLLGSAVQPSDFYTPGTGYKVYLSHPIPRCSKGCADHQLGDGKCHKKCNVSDCQFDGGDCPYEPSGAESGRTAGSSGTLSWPPPNGASQRRALDSSYFCARGCSHHWVGDGVCDVSCGSTAACGFDAGDCGLDKLTADRLAEPPSALLELADVNSSHRISEQVTALHIDLRHVLSANASYAFTVDADADSRTVSRPSVSLQQLFSDTDGSPVSDATWLWVRSAVVSWERSWLTVLLRSQDEMQQLLHLEHARRHVRDPSNTQTQPDEPALIATVVPSPRRLQLLIRLQQGQDSSVAVQVDVLQGEEAGDDDMPAMVQASRRLLHLHSPHEQLAVRPPRLALSSLRRQSLPVEVTPVRGDGRALARATAEMRSKVRAYLHEGKDKDREPHHQSAGNASFPVRNTSSVMWPWELAIDSRLWNEAWRYAEALQAGSSTDEEQLDDLAEEKLQDGDDEAAVDEQWVQQQALRASLPSRAARSSSSRRLLDLFGDQLRTGQRVLSSAYGRKHEHRSAIAHIPHLLSRSVMNEVQQRWPAMYEATSAHRFRQGSDVQMAFVYFYYLMHQTHEPDASRFARSFDRDGDGLLNAFEQRLLMKQARSGSSAEDESVWLLVLQAWAVASELDDGLIDLSVLHTAPAEQLQALAESVQRQKKFRTEKASLDAVAFVQLTDNGKQAEDELLQIALQQPKFLCINDDMRLGNSSSLRALDAFFRTLFPQPSPFERQYVPLRPQPPMTASASSRAFTLVTCFFAFVVLGLRLCYMTLLSSLQCTKAA